MERPVPPSDWVVYAVVLSTVAVMLLGKWLIFFDDKKPKESEAAQLDDAVEDILEETIEETIDNALGENK